MLLDVLFFLFLWFFFSYLYNILSFPFVCLVVCSFVCIYTHLILMYMIIVVLMYTPIILINKKFEKEKKKLGHPGLRGWYYSWSAGKVWRKGALKLCHFSLGRKQATRKSWMLHFFASIKMSWVALLCGLLEATG